MADAAAKGVAKAARNLRLQKAAVAITKAAADRLRTLLSQRDSEFIRLGVRKRGCNGLSYTMTYTNEKQKFDEQVDADGVRLLIDPGVLMHIIGTEMDFHTDRLRSEFVFNNPNSKGECGCGESFTV